MTELRTTPQGRIIRALVMLTFLAVVMSVVSTAPAFAASTYIKVNTTKPVAGASVTISGRLSTHVKRHIKVQYWTGRGWKKTGSAFWTKSDGRFSIKKIASTTSRSYRVYAYKTKIKRTTYQSKTTSSVKVLGHKATVSAQSADACGPVIKKADGTNWVCTFNDDFNGTALDRTKWTPTLSTRDGYHPAVDCTVDTPDNISVSNGTLKLTARAEKEPFICKNPFNTYETRYTTATVQSASSFAQAYGRFTFRAAMPASKVVGPHTALWMYPKDIAYGDWPRSGELDVAEFYTQYPDRAVPAIHYLQKDNPSNVSTNYNCVIDNPAAMHDYTAVWDTKGITISYDNKVCLTHTWNTAPPLLPGQPFDKPFFLILSQVLDFAPVEGSGQTPLPSVLTIDSVKAWK